jgi:hypothetical protein
MWHNAWAQSTQVGPAGLNPLSASQVLAHFQKMFSPHVKVSRQEEYPM